MPSHLYIDFETFSSVDLKECGVYQYVNSPDFQALMIAYSVNDEPVVVVDLTLSYGMLPFIVLARLKDKDTIIHAHNAAFERNVLRAMGYDIDISRFECSAVKASYCGLPMSLDEASKALELTTTKDSAGTALIRYFSIPCKPTKSNGFRTRNWSDHDPEKWERFLEYCRQDVIVEKALIEKLADYELPEAEKRYYCIDQVINDRGVKIDAVLARSAVDIDSEVSKRITAELSILTQLDNPNSAPQLSKWLSLQLQKEIKSVAKAILLDIIASTDDRAVLDVLELKQKSAKTSVKKYIKALGYMSEEDSRVRGIFQFYGAGRTGRWAGRGPQPHNLPRNNMKSLNIARLHTKDSDLGALDLLYDNVKDVLSQLLRTIFIPDDNCAFVVADYSAIEARVIAWLADELWRIDVFNSHGKIYEASASMMFGIPLEQITKDLRFKGKVAELALGYQGALGALKKMGGEAMGLSDEEMTSIVKKWRAANPNIVKLWNDVNLKAVYAVKNPNQSVSDKSGKLKFLYDGTVLTIELPSTRKLYYFKPKIKINRFGQAALSYMGVDQETKKWGYIETYGGKIIENVVQAIARDLLAFAMENLEKAKYPIVMHVHDEIIIEQPLLNLDLNYDKIIKLMCKNPAWSQGLPLGADGFITNFYKKD